MTGKTVKLPQSLKTQNIQTFNKLYNIKILLYCMWYLQNRVYFHPLDNQQFLTNSKSQVIFYKWVSLFHFIYFPTLKTVFSQVLYWILARAFKMAISQTRDHLVFQYNTVRPQRLLTISMIYNIIFVRLQKISTILHQKPVTKLLTGLLGISLRRRF